MIVFEIKIKTIYFLLQTKLSYFASERSEVERCCTLIQKKFLIGHIHMAAKLIIFRVVVVVGVVGEHFRKNHMYIQ